MANTYTQIYIQLVFAVAKRDCLIEERIRNRVEKYMCGIVSHLDCKPMAVYCNPDHCHLLISMHPARSVADTAKTIKAQTSKWMNDHQLTETPFHWQSGYGVLSYNKNELRNVIDYILNQPIHHKRKTFRDEYIEMLREAQIDFNPLYIFSAVI